MSCAEKHLSFLTAEMAAVSVTYPGCLWSPTAQRRSALPRPLRHPPQRHLDSTGFSLFRNNENNWENCGKYKSSTLSLLEWTWHCAGKHLVNIKHPKERLKCPFPAWSIVPKVVASALFFQAFWCEAIWTASSLRTFLPSGLHVSCRRPQHKD